MWWKLSSFLKDHDIPENIRTQAQRAEITQAAKLIARNRFEEESKICREHQNSLQKSASDEIKSCSEEANKRASSSISSIKLIADSAILQAKKSAEQEILRILQSLKLEAMTSIIEITPSPASPLTSFVTVFQSLPPVFPQAGSPTSSPDTSPILPSLLPQTIQPVLETSTSLPTCNNTIPHSVLFSVAASPSLFATIFISWTILSGLISATFCYLIVDHYRSRKVRITGNNDPKANDSNINQRRSFRVFSSDENNDKEAQRNVIKTVIDDEALENEIQVGLAIELHESKSKNPLDISSKQLEQPGSMSELTNKNSMTWFPASEQPVRNTVEWLSARDKYLLDASKGYYLEQNSLENTVVRDPGQIYGSNLVIEGSNRNSNVGKAI